MISDETLVVAYKWHYKTHDGRDIDILSVYDYERKGVTIHDALSDAKNRHPEDEYTVMTFAEFDELDRKLTLAREVMEIDEETFNEMLNVLPPLKWVDRMCKKHRCCVNEFCMSEFDHSVYTEQYARAYIDGKTRYYCATVDFYDESTWIHNRL